MDERAKILSEMAQLDAQLFELHKALQGYPRRLEDARKQLLAEGLFLDELRTPWNELEHQVREKEATIQVALDTIEKFEEHIKRVTTQKEYMAAKKQVEEARRLNSQLQDEILENRVKQEEIEPQLKEVQGRYNNVLATYQEEESGINKEKERVESDVAKQQDQLQSMAGDFDDRFWGYYQRLVKGGKLPAIVPAPGGTCGGCNMAIPPQSYNLMIANPETIHNCSHCNRIVYYQAPEGGTGEEPAEEPALAEAPLSEAASGS